MIYSAWEEESIMKKIFYLMILIVLLLGISCVSAESIDDQRAAELAKQFMEEYNLAHVEEIFPRFEYVQINNDTVFWIKALEWETVYDRVAGDFYDFVKTNIDITDSYLLDSETVVIEAFDSCEFHYHSDPDDVDSAYGIEFVLTIKVIDGEYYIVGIETDSNDGYYHIKSRAEELQNEGFTYVDSISKAFDERIADVDRIYSDWKTMCKEADDNMVMESEIDTQETVNINATTVSYNPSLAVNYAIIYGPKDKSGTDMVFKPASKDCTNFVSQCIWAGYGGTNSNSMTNVTSMRTLVDNKYRMTSTWYGRSRNSTLDPSNKFVRVIELYSYMTGNTSSGPKGNGYNNNNVWNQLTVIPQLGDILQIYTFDSNGVGKYGHSVIVTKINSPNLNSDAGLLDRVRVTQHQSSQKNRTLRNLIESNCLNGNTNTAKMRLLRPKQTTF